MLDAQHCRAHDQNGLLSTGWFPDVTDLTCLDKCRHFAVKINNTQFFLMYIDHEELLNTEILNIYIEKTVGCVIYKLFYGLYKLIIFGGAYFSCPSTM